MKLKDITISMDVYVKKSNGKSRGSMNMKKNIIRCGKKFHEVIIK